MQRRHWNPHRRIQLGLVVILSLAFLAAVGFCQNGLIEAPMIQLKPLP